MKTVLQRVKSASVTVDGQLVSSIGKGLLVLAGVARDDTAKEAESMAGKVLKAKLWEDDQERKWKRNVQDIGGEILCVSQFTLLASTKKSSPDFRKAAPPTQAKELYDRFMSELRSQYQPDRVKDGVFQAMMDVSLINDGPVTIEIDTEPPPMANPTKFDVPEDASVKTKIQQTFTLPASLLE